MEIIVGKVEKNLRVSLDSIPSPSPSVKIQTIGGKVVVIRQNIAGRCQQTFDNKKFVDITKHLITSSKLSRQ